MVHYITGLWSSVKFNALQQAWGNYSSNMRLSPQARQELVWWIDNIATASKPAQCPNPDPVLQSDASHMGWGAVGGNITTGGRWTAREQKEHSLETELHIQVQLDKSTAVAYINNMVSTKSQQLNYLAL